MKIDRLVKKDDTTVIVYLDNNEKLYLSYEVILKSGLRKNEEISEDRFSLLIEENKKYFINQRALNYLGRRVHSSREIKNKLLQKGYEKNLIEEVVSSLVEKQILNDSEFARIYIDEKLRLKKWGIRKLKSELIKKGISESIIREVIVDIPDENQFNSAIDIAKKKLKLLSARESDSQKIKQKLYSSLSSKGFSYDVISKVINKLLKGESED